MNTISIRKTNLIFMLLSFGTLVLIMCLPLNKNTTIFSVVITSANVVYMLFLSLKQKKYIYMIFVAMIFELLIVMTWLIYFVRLPETSWRRMFYSDELNFYSMRYICISLLIFVCIYFASNFKKDRITYSIQKIKINNTFFLLFCLGILAYFLVFIKISGFFSIRDYKDGASSTLISIYRILQAIYITLYMIGDIQGRKLTKIFQKTILIGFILLDLIMGLFGYRFILIEMLFFLYFINMERIKKIRFRNIVLLGIVVFGLYFFLSLIRNTVTTSESVMESFFKHERNIYYSLNAIVKNRPENPINTYISTISNMLPSVITGKTYENTGRILVDYIDKGIANLNAYTMGGFFLTEAFFTYGFIGIIVISLLFAILFSIFEYKVCKENGMIMKLLYYFIAAQTYSIVYYGSSNYIKITIYYLLFIILFWNIKGLFTKP